MNRRVGDSCKHIYLPDVLLPHQPLVVDAKRKALLNDTKESVAVHLGSFPGVCWEGL